MASIPIYREINENLEKADDKLFVCTEHLKFEPCRRCLSEGTNFMSSRPEDIERVSKYQKGGEA